MTPKLADHPTLADEQTFLDWVAEHYPRHAHRSRLLLQDARDAILARLFVAVVREKLMPAGAIVLDDPETDRLTVQLPDDTTLVANVARRYAFGRFTLAGGIRHEPTGETLRHPLQLLDLVQPVSGLDGDAVSRRERFAAELTNSVANMALARLGAAMRQEAIRTEAEARGVRSSLDWVRQTGETDPLTFFEQWVIDGHPLHPGAKLRFGVPLADVPAQAPEWGATTDLRLVAVRREACRIAAIDGLGPAERLFGDYPVLRATVTHALRQKGLDPAAYELIPVHPWQWQHVLPVRYADAIARHDVVLLDEARIPCRPLVSVRSLAPVQPGGHHLKTAIGVQTTGAVRTISQQAAGNGPAMTILLKRVLAAENHFDRRLVVLGEPTGVHYLPADGSPDAADQARHLAAIIRENPAWHVREGELAMPAAALIEASPVSGKPILIEVVEALATAKGIPHPPLACQQFLDAYGRVCLPALLTLMTRYGISLEAHLQNSVAVFKEGEPVRMLIRDFGGVRLHRERIRAAGFDATFVPGSATVIEDVGDLQNKLLYPLLQNHLGMLVAVLADWSGLSESELWRPLAALCRQTLTALADDPRIADQAKLDAQALFAATVDLKAMVAMRLKGDVTDYTFAAMPNPLARVWQEGLNDAETAVAEHVRSTMPDRLADWTAAVPQARQRILHRLVMALWREGLLTAEASPPQPEGHWVSLPHGARFHIPVRSRHAFRRIEVEGALTVVMPDGTHTYLNAPGELIDRLMPDSDGEREAWSRLKEELDNGVANLALAMVVWQRRQAADRTFAESIGAATILDVIEVRRTEPGFDATLYFEQLGLDGHRLHPGAKTKLGMAPDAVQAYAPEFGTALSVRLIGVRRACLAQIGVETGKTMADILYQAFPGLESQVQGAWPDTAGPLAEYDVIPVHPWQLAHALPVIYARELAAGDIVPIPDVGIPARATASFRTVMPVAGQAPAMKLAVNSLMTSSLRSISAQAATNGPAFSRLIGRIWEREPRLRRTLTPVLEIAGVHFREMAEGPTLTPAQRQTRSRNLSVLLREPINELLQPDEVAIVGCALYAQSPVTGQPVLVDLIRRYAATRDEATLAEAAAAFFADYLSLLVEGVIRLMTQYGIGLECHLQNVVPVFVDGRPVRMLIRDWGGLRLFKPRLHQQGLTVETLPGSVTVTSDLADVHDKVSYTLLQNHLAELIVLLDRHDLVPEASAWRQVRQALDAAFATMAETAGVDPTSLAADQAALLAPQMPYKALTRMRLTPDQPGYRTVLVPSPVADGPP